jgi:Flp pilus assembly protein TadG
MGTNTLVTSGTIRDVYVKKMGTKADVRIKIFDHHRLSNRAGPCATSKGQALVEFTLIFLLLLIVAWIPADFGLAFYTGQMAHNASREGARIAAADPAADTLVGSCGLAACFALADTHPRYRAATRVSAALMPDTTVNLEMVTAGTCNQQVRMTVSGTYNFFFYHLLGWFGVDTNPATITRVTEMRWEHQC